MSAFVSDDKKKTSNLQCYLYLREQYEICET